MASAPCAGRDRGHHVSHHSGGPSEWESCLPPEVLRVPEDLGRVDGLLDDPVFLAPFVPFFRPALGRPSTPVECYLRLMS
jgi:IS5 family transposase